MRSLCLEPLGLTVSDAAKALGISRKTLSGIVNGRVGISPEMAVRLSLAFDTTAESWLHQQAQYDLWRAEKKRASLRVKRLCGAHPVDKVWATLHLDRSVDKVLDAMRGPRPRKT